MISTRDLSSFPDPITFRRLMRSLAALDAILSPRREWRYYSFDSRWADGESMASMYTGDGDQWFAVLCRAGVALHGLAHESPSFQMGQPQPWVFRDLPSEFHENLLNEPAFDTANSTFCIWRLESHGEWRTGVRTEQKDQPLEDGSGELLAILAGDPRQYVEFAHWYYEVDVALDDVRAVYRHEPLTTTLATRLNKMVDLEVLQVDVDSIGYPEAR